MYNYQIIIEYLGTNFIGWQIQKNGVSIQHLIEKAINKVLKKKIKVIGSGRTDAGVHALGQSANFFSKQKIEDKYKFLNSVNFFLKDKTISIKSVKKKKRDFHARYSVKKKIYEYIILNRNISSPFYDKRSWLIRKKLDLKEMKKGIKFFSGTHDFTSMRASSCTAKNPVKLISKAQIKKKKEKIIVIFESKSFLQNQVRSMVGCLKYVGENKWKSNKIKFVLKSKKRNFCAPPAPACGLYLKKVIY